ncbi:hypothetical protein Cadr_000019058 [Camelus dromedarius]|uniref:Uncharacterized protein n=1 Tax=Camelus dromedarius TaxID=9838 RepID=A0A5N4D239_CAMDR|nr:hypothetical protein Cadr_000019058 [Camelus dromedarius]
MFLSPHTCLLPTLLVLNPVSRLWKEVVSDKV